MIAELLLMFALNSSPALRWEPAGSGQALYRGTQQLGFKDEAGLYYPLLGPGRLGSPCPAPTGDCDCGCPCKAPCKCKDTGVPCGDRCRCVLASGETTPPLTGVVAEKIQPGHTSINGREVSRKVAIEAIEAGIDPEDEKKLRVTVIGLDADRKVVEQAFVESSLLAAMRDRLLFQSLPPDSWQVQGAGFVTAGNPTIYCQAPDGRVVHRQDGWRGAEKMAEALRKAAPDYDPKKDPDLNKPTFDFKFDPKYLILAGVALVVGWKLWSKQ